MTNPSPNDIDAVLAQVERQSKSPRELAREAVERHRARPRGLTQAQIDSGADVEDRRQRFVASAVKWSKRSLFARLFRR